VTAALYSLVREALDVEGEGDDDVARQTDDDPDQRGPRRLARGLRLCHPRGQTGMCGCASDVKAEVEQSFGGRGRSLEPPDHGGISKLVR
jgi:hypothetical protein